MNGHKFDLMVSFCEQCGVGMDEDLEFNIPCFPNARGVAFTIRRREACDRLVSAVLGEMNCEMDGVLQ